MSYNLDLINGIFENLSRQKKAAEEAARQNAQAAFALPEYDKLMRQIAKLQFEYIENGKDESVLVKVNRLKNQADELLAEKGLNSQNMTPAYRCQKCADTGKINGKYCDCIKPLYEAALLNAWDITLPSLPAVDRDKTAVTDDTQLKMLKTLKTAFKKYADNYPAVNRPNILLMGGTGVGKTHLATGLFYMLKNRGFWCIFLTALELNGLLLKYHTSPADERSLYFNALLDCDFLFIDDLGTEQQLKNVTAEYLLQIINTRISRKKPFIVTTNLDQTQLESNYSERLFSRLADKKLTFRREIKGGDIRLN